MVGHNPPALDMLCERTDHTKEEWWEEIENVTSTYNYEMEHNVTKSTKAEARKAFDTAAMKFNHELKRRTYPTISVDDQVRTSRIAYRLDKERASSWTEST